MAMDINAFLEKWVGRIVGPCEWSRKEFITREMKADLEEMMEEAKMLGYPGAIISEDDSHA